MNNIALDKLRFNAKLLITMLVMLTLSMFAIHSQTAQADATDTGDSTQARFDHMTTGFPLTGAHAIANCGSCHVGGVFKGTPHNCNSCHIKGQRIVAIDMPATHIATTQQCDVCHTNTVTFFGAYYNHGLAVPGQCTSCHNGSVTTGRPSSHTLPPKSTTSCDNCHRTTAWLPSFFLHTGVIGSCSGCHLNAQVVGSSNIRNSMSGSSPEAFAHGAQNTSLDCYSCHTNFSTWYGAMYDHATAGTPCFNCHNGVRATAATQIAGTTPEAFAHNSQNAATGAIDCVACHHTTASWIGALYDHSGAGVTCSTCHNGNRATGLAQAIALYSSHVTSGECNTCHTSTTTWLGATGSLPSNHIPYNGTACTTCHVNDFVTPVNTNTLHTNVSTQCNSCHYKGGPIYLGNIQQSNHAGNINCGSGGGCHSPTNFTSWNR